MSLQDRLGRFADDFVKFEDIPPERRLSPRQDLNAFLLLDRLVPDTDRILGGADHDVIFLNIDEDALDAAASDDDIRDLVRSGVRYDGSYDCLTMFT